MIKTTSMLKEEFSNYQDPFGKIRRLVNDGKLFPVTKGIYETEPNLSGYLLCPVIYGPSYISFEYALAYYDIIPEAVYTYTSATCLKGKKKTYENHFGTYTYRDIPKSAYPYALELREENGYPYFMASREKALLDKIYTISPVKNLDQLEQLLYLDLRIDASELRTFSIETIKGLSELYHSNNVRILARYMEKMK